MKKLVFLLMILPVQLFAQFEIGMFSTPSQLMVENAVKSSFFLSKQSYQLRDKKSGELFGVNGKKEFSAQYAIGVKVRGGIILGDRMLQPWLYDSKFGKYKEGYEPVPYQATYTALEDEVSYKELEYDSEAQKGIIDKLIYRYPSDVFAGEGLAADSTAGIKNGWIIWVTAKETDWEKTAAVNYVTYQKDLNVSKEDTSFGIEKPKGNLKLLGGLYVVPFYTGIGTIEFKLCGIIVQDTETTWKVCCPFVVNPENEVKPADKQAVESELTPIGKDKTDKKNKKRDRK